MTRWTSSICEYICKVDCVNNMVWKISFRTEATLHHVAELNPYVQVLSSTVSLDETTDISFLSQYQVCCFGNACKTHNDLVSNLRFSQRK